jgi:excisionase family DNA binding protein
MKNIEESNKLMKANEVAELLNVHINTVRRWSNQGLIKAQRIGPRGDRRFDREEIENFLNGGKK